MTPRAALARWLADRDAQATSLRRIERFAHEYGAHSLVRQLERDLAALQERTPEALIGAARAFMDGDRELDALMRALFAESRADPFFRPPFHPVSSEIHESLLLYHHPDLSISFGVTGLDMLAAKKTGRRGPASINFTGFVTLLRFIKAGSATLSFWEAPEITAGFSAASAGRCRLVERRRIRDGEDILVDGRRQSFVIEHAAGDILFFQAVARTGGAPVGAEFDSEGHHLVGATSADEASSRLEMMVSLLRALERDEAFPLLEEALGNPNFHTRWHVMREMLAMDADAALPSLRKLASDDPHPDVRAAARQALSLFFVDEEQIGAMITASEGAACRA
ncbi:HEAT repeat domain-containing protein [Sphingosinicella sp. CPCC 101087]|uniref:HEAT repeat domain-containing protein n=1 Tax=Sphingosinicella sp. CPCC 101087 TaxID=2497754 RepID=UPI00101CBC2D|nr:HEAT repeat domain-containing protein [Sphingosinicella sp. CPCC 101087]